MVFLVEKVWVKRLGLVYQNCSVEQHMLKSDQIVELLRVLGSPEKLHLTKRCLVRHFLYEKIKFQRLDEELKVFEGFACYKFQTRQNE